MKDFTNSVNSLYNYEAVKDQMKSSFKTSKPSVLLLSDFLIKTSSEELRRKTISDKGKERYIPHECRYNDLTIGNNLDIFSSKEFLTFIREISGIKVTKSNISACKFNHRSFTLLHDELDDKERLVFFYMLAPKWDFSWGGQTIFTFGDDREPLIFNVQNNSFVLLKVPKGMRSFVKYVNHFARENELILFQGTLT